MKSKQISVLILLFLLTACVSNETREALNRSETLLVDEPQKALEILDNIPPKALVSHASRARHALLSTIAQDRISLNVTEDSTISIAYNWYKRHGRELNRLKATYYLSVVRQNAGKDIEAAIQFKEAETLAERMRERRYQSLSEQHLSAIYAQNYDRLRALSYAEKSRDTALEAGDSLMADYCRWDIANQYISDFRFEEAESLLCELLNTSRDTLAFSALVLRSLAKVYLYKQPEKYEVAKTCYEAFERKGCIDFSSQDYGYLSLIYEAEGNVQLADQYSEVARQNLRTAVDSIVFFEIEGRRFDLRGDIDNAYQAFRQSKELENDVISDILSQSITHALEQNYEDILALEKERTHARLYLFIIFCFVVIGFIVWLVSRLRQSRKRILEDMAAIQDFNDDLQRLREQNLAISDVLNSFVDDKIQSLKHLADTYFSWELESVRQREKKKGRDTKEEVIESFRKQLESLRGNQSLIKSLEHTLNLSRSNLMERVRKLLQDEKNVDYDYLVLLFSGTSIKSICYLKQSTEVAVRMRKTRLKQLFLSFPNHEGEEFAQLLGA